MDGDIEESAANVEEAKTPDSLPERVPGEAQQVKTWLKKIEASKKHFKKAFDRIEKCQQIAAHGAYKEWLENEWRYVVPVLNRHINQAVSQLYAKNPIAVVERRKRLLHTVWDGTQEQVQQIGAMAMLGDPNASAQLVSIQQDIAQAQAQENMVELAAKTLDLLYKHQIEQQPFVFKTKIKQIVRRTKVNGVAYIKVNFLREKDMRPETAALAEDTVSKLKTIERLQTEVMEADAGSAEGDDLDAKRLELESLLADIQNNPDRVVREQLIYDYPRTREIILDAETRDIKTLEGCNWLAHQFDHTAERIQDIYGVDIGDLMGPNHREAMKMLEDGKDQTYRLYEVQNKYTKQVFVICEGLDRYLQAPREPDIWFERFFNVFPLVFNEIEHDKEIYPPSDVWAGRHMQFEYNRSREALREHRIAARPYWVARKGRLEETEKARLKSHAAHEIVEVMVDDPKAPISSILDRGPTAPLDPNLYEVEGIHTDLLRTVGTQEANLGGTSGATATESSIAENSRMSSLSDNVDDLDDMLTALARASGQVLLQEMTKERVVEIVGPGAVWPEMLQTRRQLADQVTLTVKAGSSGRPNQAAKLANMERAWPAMSQLPGINPEPLAESYAELLDIDFDELNRMGALSIVAQNAMAGPAPVGSVPEAQGSRGGERPPSADPGGAAQPAFPSGAPGTDSQGLA